MKPANEITNQDVDYDEYMDSVMSQLFNHEIIWKLNKIFKHVEDVKKLDEVKQIFKSDNYKFDDCIKRCFNYTDNSNESENDIAYWLESCENVNSAIRNKLNKVDDYELGDILICRKVIKLNIKEMWTCKLSLTIRLWRLKVTLLHYQI